MDHVVQYLTRTQKHIYSATTVHLINQYCYSRHPSPSLSHGTNQYRLRSVESGVLRLKPDQSDGSKIRDVTLQKLRWNGSNAFASDHDHMSSVVCVRITGWGVIGVDSS